jgi:hypothetical protein
MERQQSVATPQRLHAVLSHDGDVQAADYLCADLRLWCTEVWRRKPKASEAEAVVAALRARLPPPLCERVCSSNPVVAGPDSLECKLAKLPPGLHAHACKSCARPLRASAPSQGLELYLQLEQLSAFNAASAALLQVPDLRRVEVILNTREPRPRAREDAALRHLNAQLQHAPKKCIELHASCRGWVPRPRAVATMCGNLARQLSRLPAARSLEMGDIRMRDSGAAVLANAVTSSPR